jgi:hypothetical protein
MALIAGNFKAYINPLGGNSSGGAFTFIGGTREGYRLVPTMHHQPVISDLAGKGQIDGIQQGADYILSCDYIEYDLIKAYLFNQVSFGATYNNVGHRLTDLAGTLALRPIAGTPAEADMGVGNCLLCYRAIVVDDLEILFASKLRQGPMRWKLFPDVVTPYNAFTITTAPSGVT